MDKLTKERYAARREELKREIEKVEARQARALEQSRAAIAEMYRVDFANMRGELAYIEEALAKQERSDEERELLYELALALRDTKPVPPITIGASADTLKLMRDEHSARMHQWGEALRVLRRTISRERSESAGLEFFESATKE